MSRILADLCDELDKKSAKEVRLIMTKALDYMKQYNGRSKYECIAMAMGYRQTEDEYGNITWSKENE